jgi:hypothetical protein
VSVAGDLADQHRRRQLALRALTIRELLVLWGAVDFARLADTWPAFEVGALTLVQLRRRASAALASNYVTAARAAADIPGAAPIVLADTADPAAVRVSLQATGLATAKRLTADVGGPAAERSTLVRMSGAVSRHVLDGGRLTVINSVYADRRAVAWYRVTSPHACDFCLMLAGRGAVYRDRTVAFKSHDHCACTARPVYQ